MPNSHKSRTLIVQISYLLIGLSCLSLQPASAETTPPGGNFCLQGSAGETCLADFKDKVVLLYFGYMTCPDVCPTSLSTLQQVKKGLNAQIKNSTQVIVITIDPERDTIAALNTYLSYFDPSFIGLTGDIVTIKQVADQYGVSYKKTPIDSAIGYAVDHSAAIYIIDRKGQWIGQFKHQTSVQDMIDGIHFVHQQNQ